MAEEIKENSKENLDDEYLYEIEYQRDGCIGAAACELTCPENWKLADDGKANFKKKYLKKEDFEKNMEAAKSCPVNVIHIIEKKTKRRLI